MNVCISEAANSSKETRKILMKFLEFPQIHYLLGKMGVGADPKNYIDESSPPPATNEAAMARSLEEHESVFSSAEFHTADVASVGDEEEEDVVHKEKKDKDGMETPELSPKHKIHSKELKKNHIIWTKMVAKLIIVGNFLISKKLKRLFISKTKK